LSSQVDDNNLTEHLHWLVSVIKSMAKGRALPVKAQAAEAMMCICLAPGIGTWVQHLIRNTIKLKTWK
jgi:hypothetical protein